MIVLGEKEYYKGIGQIKFEGAASDNPLAFKYYNPDQVVAGKTMREHFRFAIAYWHTFCGQGSDPFGPGTQHFAWDQSSDPYQASKDKADAAFEFISKMGFDYFCFHDYDLIAEGATFAESEKRIAYITEYLKKKKAESGIKLLWGTANCFSNPRYMNGASTNPDFNVVARAGGQVKLALDATIALDGENYVFWGGREGYMSLLNTNMGRELDHMAQFLTMSRDYARAQGFKGNFFIEPKPMEPMKHQYEQHCNAAGAAELGVPVIKKLKKKYIHLVDTWINEKKIIKVDYKDETSKIIDRVLSLALLPKPVGKKNNHLMSNQQVAPQWV